MPKNYFNLQVLNKHLTKSTETDRFLRAAKTIGNAHASRAGIFIVDQYVILVYAGCSKNFMH